MAGTVELGGIVAVAFGLIRLLERMVDALLARYGKGANGVSLVDHRMLLALQQILASEERQERMLERILDRFGGGNGRRR